MKKRIISVIVTLCMVVGIFTAVPMNVVAAGWAFSNKNIQYGSYGAIYFTLAKKDFYDGYGYINCEPIDELREAEILFSSVLNFIENVQTINIVLTRDWDTDCFVTYENASVNIDLNGHTWKINGSSRLCTKNKNITISGGTMIFNSTAEGPLTTYGGNIDIRNTVFKNTKTSGYGLIYVDDGEGGTHATINLKNVTFENCYSGSYGGCIYIDSDNSTINADNCRFIDCSAYDSGGAIYFNEEKIKANFNSCQFINCKSGNNGGAISIAEDNCDISFYACKAINCHADDCGGFIYVYGLAAEINGFGNHDSSTVDERSVVVNCHCAGGGGAIYTSDAAGCGHYAIIKNFVFAANAAGATSRFESTANKKGGAVSIYSELCKINYCDFYNNYAGGGGGAIFLQDINCEISDCTFENDCIGSDKNGTEIYVSEYKSTVKNNTFYTGETQSNAFYNPDKCLEDDNVFNPTESYDGGDGSASNPYQIKTSAQLRLLARKVNAGESYSGKYFVLTDDIKNMCVPIGHNFNDKPFSGHFDGKGHSVTLAIYNTQYDSGLFSYLKNAEVKNVYVKGFVNGATVGGIAGNITKSVVSGCTNEAQLSNPGYGNAGGIGGYVCDESVIYQCKNIGRIKGDKNIGGILGQAKNTKIVECYNIGEISSTVYDAGGIVGHVTDSMFIKNCTNDAPVSSKDSVGGIIGATFATMTVINCYNTHRGIITASNASAGGIVGYSNSGSQTKNGATTCLTKKIYNCLNYADINGKNHSGGIIGYSIEAAPSGASGNPIEIYNCVSNCKVPAVEFSGQISGKGYQGTYEKCYIGSEQSNTDGISNEKLTNQQFGQELVDKLNSVANSKNGGKVASDSDDLTYYTEAKAGDWTKWTVDAGLKMAVPLTNKDFLYTEKRNELGGKGTQDEPYTVSGNGQLITLQKDIEEGKSFAGCYFRLKKDIDYTGKPIGSPSHPFSGIFDGNGYSILIDIDMPSSEYCALFGCLSNGTVKNLTVNGRVIGKNYAAGLVAKASGNVTIENCFSDLVSVTANESCAAGICAASEGTVLIKNCRNCTPVTSKSTENYVFEKPELDIVYKSDSDSDSDSDSNSSSNNDSSSGTKLIAPKITITVPDPKANSAPNPYNPYGNNSERDEQLLRDAEKKAEEARQRNEIEREKQKSRNMHNQCAAGIIGNITGGDATVVNTVNFGKINAYSRVGGIAAHSDADSLKIYNCANYGSLSATNANYAAIGGIVGHALNLEMLVCFNSAKVTELMQSEAGKDAHYGALIGLVDNMSVFGTCYYYKPTGYWVPAYNAGTENVDTDNLTATAITSANKILFRPSKFNNANYDEKETYGFSNWAKVTIDATNGFPMPENFVAVTNNNTDVSLTGSVFGENSIPMLVVLFTVSLIAVTVVIIYKKKRKTVNA